MDILNTRFYSNTLEYVMGNIHMYVYTELLVSQNYLIYVNLLMQYIIKTRTEYCTSYFMKSEKTNFLTDSHLDIKIFAR